MEKVIKVKPAKVKTPKPERTKTDRKLRRSIIALIVILAIIIFLLLINVITDWEWFREIGYTSVFFKQLVTELKFGIPIFAVVTLFMIAYLMQIKRGYFKKIISHEAANNKAINRGTYAASIIFGAAVSFYIVHNLWFELLTFVNATDFGIKDPLFGLDISFYIFKLDFLTRLDEMIITLIIITIVITLIYYMVLLTVRTPDFYDRRDDTQGTSGSSDGSASGIFSGGRTKAVSKINMHSLLEIASGKIIILCVVFFLMLAAFFVLKQFDLLHSHNGVVYGAGYSDVKVTLWVYRILTVLSLAGAVVSSIGILKKSPKKFFAVPLLMIAVAALGVGARAIVQNIVVSPDEINKESPYLANNIKYTQYAYGIDDVDVRNFAASNDLTAEDIRNNSETIDNIRINDYEPVETFYNQTQSIRQYYTFNDTDVDRYTVDGEYMQTYLSVREIDESKINDTWINRHLKYTHGYGAAVSRVDSITASGQPEVIVKDIPPVSSAEEIEITRPEVYFGELSNDYIIVNSDEDEFDYPNGNENAYTRYEGTAGIKLGPINRLMFAIREGSLKILVSTNVNNDSRIVINRNIMDRVEKIMPYLSYDSDPYGVVIDGKIYWIIDAYTTSSYYPYSEPYSGQTGTTNYIRNSVKVVIDAYNGTVDYYVVDEDDPIAKTLQKIYPKLFKDYDEMPEEMKLHIRYPNELLQIQAEVYGRYHMTDTKVFYQNEDIWDISDEIYGTEEVKMTPNFFVLKLPGESKAEFVSMIAYSPKSKQNMTALLLSRNDGDNYGDLVLYSLPKNRTIYGPMQIEAQIDQNTEISQDFSLWSQAGSRYSRGNLFIVPIEDSLLYIEPIYLEASNSAIPEVKRVVIAYNDKIAYENTLAEALVSLFGDYAADVPEDTVTNSGDGTDTADTVEELVKAAAEAYDNAQEALKEGNWDLYGDYMTELETALEKLSDATGADVTVSEPASGTSSDSTDTSSDSADTSFDSGSAASGTAESDAGTASDDTASGSGADSNS
ncbi:MAG: UPF0182 family protein [Eubacterium sp.]